MRQRYTWNKAEKLKSRKRIDQVFKQGRNFSVFPFKVFYLVSPRPIPPGSGVSPEAPDGVPPRFDAPPQHSASPRPGSGVPPQPNASPRPGSDVPPRPNASPLQAGFGAGTRNFKKAVDRNRIKRVCREAYRLQKQSLIDNLGSRGLSMAVFFVYIGKDLPDYQTVTGKIGVILQKLVKETA